MISIEKHLLGPLGKVSIMVWQYLTIWMRFLAKSELFAKSAQKLEFEAFLKNIKNQAQGCSNRFDMFGNEKSMSQ